MKTFCRCHRYCWNCHSHLGFMAWQSTGLHHHKGLNFCLQSFLLSWVQNVKLGCCNCQNHCSFCHLQNCFRHHQIHYGASLVAQLVKNLLAMQETWVQSLGWEDPLEEGTATHSSILAWRNPMDREACGLGESHITEQLSIAQTRCSCPHCLRIRHQHSCHQRHLDH